MAAIRQVLVSKALFHGHRDRAIEKIRKAREKFSRKMEKLGRPVHKRALESLRVPGIVYDKEMFYQIVATKAEETPRFKAVQDLFIFFPDEADPIVRQRLTSASTYDVGWAFHYDKLGIFPSMFRAGMDRYIQDIPGAIQAQTAKGPRWLVDGPGGLKTPLMAYPEAIFAVQVLYIWVFSDWLPNNFLGGGKPGLRKDPRTGEYVPTMFPRGKRTAPPQKSGLFHTRTHANMVASLYDITIDMTAISKDWLRTPQIPALTDDEMQRYKDEQDLERGRKLVDMYYTRIPEEERKFWYPEDICDELIKPNFPHNWEEICKKLGLIG